MLSPAASKSRTSLTRMRMPLTQGRPPHCFGLNVMRSRSASMGGQYTCDLGKTSGQHWCTTVLAAGSRLLGWASVCAQPLRNGCTWPLKNSLLPPFSQLARAVLSRGALKKIRGTRVPRFEHSMSACPRVLQVRLVRSLRNEVAFAPISATGTPGVVAGWPRVEGIRN